MTLYAAVIGASLWIVTEILEMRSPVGHTPVSLWLTTMWHPFVAAGFWGLHKAQSPRKNTLSLAATILVMIGFIAFAPLSVLFLNSGESSLDAFTQERPFFAVAKLLVAIGILLFSAAIIRSRYYPAWMAYGLAGAFLLVLIKNALGLPETLQHAGFIILSLMIISMVVTAMSDRASRAGRAG